MTRSETRVRRLELEARKGADIEVWWESLRQPGMFDRLDDAREPRLSRIELDALPLPNGTQRIVVEYVDGNPNEAED
jgi:hypothetical protein